MAVDSKLLYITQYYPPEVGAGAVRSNIMSRYLAQDGWDVDVVCEKPNYPTGVIDENFREKWVYKEIVNENLTVHRIWSVANERKNLLQQLLFFLSFMVTSFIYMLCNPKRYDIVYVTSPPIFTGVAGYLLSKIFGARFVFEVRDIWPDSAVNQTELDGAPMFLRLGKKLEDWL